MSLDLFEAAGITYVPTETRLRVIDACTMLRDAHPRALDVIVHLDWWHKRDVRSPGTDGDWAYLVNRAGIHYEAADRWWAGDPIPECVYERFSNSWDPRTGWARTPHGLVTWSELADAVQDHPERPALVAWAEGKPWSEIRRPFGFYPNPERWHPGYIAGDRAAPGWEARKAAWDRVVTILTDTINAYQKALP